MNNIMCFFILLIVMAQSSCTSFMPIDSKNLKEEGVPRMSVAYQEFNPKITKHIKSCVIIENANGKEKTEEWDFFTGPCESMIIPIGKILYEKQPYHKVMNITIKNGTKFLYEISYVPPNEITNTSVINGKRHSQKLDVYEYLNN